MSVIGTCFLVLGLATAAGSDSSPGPQAGPAQARARGNDKGAQAEKKRKPRFTISRETTYVTGPRDADGYIDYPAALNMRLRQGVTPANNAVVLLWKALGPRPEGRRVAAEFFQALGIRPPPERGDYFIDLSYYTKEHLKSDARKRIADQLDRAVQTPWATWQYPRIASWLRANEKPLAVVIEATKRSRYFSPLVPTRTKQGSSGLMGAPVSGVQACRGFAQALAARAMLRLGDGAYEDAWQDLLACHRLGRLVGSGGTLIEALVGMALERVASRADLTFLELARLNAQQIQKCLRDLQTLPRLPEIAEKVDLTERFVFLDIVMMMDGYGVQWLGNESGGEPKGLDPLAELLWKDIDWDPALRNSNRWYDGVVATLREKDRVSREKKLDKLTPQLQALRKKSADPVELAHAITAGTEPAKAKGNAIGGILIASFMPAVHKPLLAADRTRQGRDNLTLAFALAWYQRDHGHYPKRLSALVPKYLAHVPPDLFSGRALIYRPSRGGYLLYSVGVNGKDEEGRGYDDEPPGDDLSVRMRLR